MPVVEIGAGTCDIGLPGGHVLGRAGKTGGKRSDSIGLATLITEANAEIENEQARKELQQKMARQKRKPRRLAENDTPQNLAPRSGQVRRSSHRNRLIPSVCLALPV